MREENLKFEEEKNQLLKSIEALRTEPKREPEEL